MKSIRIDVSRPIKSLIVFARVFVASNGIDAIHALRDAHVGGLGRATLAIGYRLIFGNFIVPERVFPRSNPSYVGSGESRPRSNPVRKLSHAKSGRVLE